jgi:hypothetical protein
VTPENALLLSGPYRPPRLKVGDRATCLYRDRDVAVTGWTDARIPWPRGLPLGRKGQPSLVVNEALARAVRRESARAVCFWWGVSYTYPVVLSHLARAFLRGSSKDLTFSRTVWK